jgi:FlaA1/EpsC-like NDP-sugar epimerase
MAKIEIFDTGRLLSSIARDRNFSVRRRLSRISVPLLVVADLLMLLVAFAVTLWALQIPASRNTFRIAMPVRILPTFIALTLFCAYSTVWSRAMFSNYFRLMLACAAGAVAGGVGVLLASGLSGKHVVPATLLYFFLSFILVSAIRVLRPAFRDLFYAIDCSQLKARRDVSRILVYGAGLRYRAFRRELVRRTSENTRIIVGIIDDDQFLQGRYIGRIRVAGTLDNAPEIVDELNVDSVVITCKLDEERLRRAKEVFASCGVKVTNFIFCEKEV